MNLDNIKGVIKYDYDLKQLTWFKVGGMADILFKPFDIQDLILLLKENNGNVPITILGAGSNIIIRDKGIEGLVIKLGKNFTNIELINHNLISVGAGCLNFNLAKFCLANSIPNFEFLVGIPGTVGGGVAMNAGAYNCDFKDIVNSVEALDYKGNLVKFTLAEIGFKYRANSLPQNLIFTKVFFNITKIQCTDKIKQKMDEINAQRKLTQPTGEKTGGSTFANPKTNKAWELIDKAGMRGAKIGDACMSELHCNFMINKNQAKAADMEKLGELVIKKVKEKTGITLNWEIKRIGRK